MYLNNKEQKALIAIFDIVKNSVPRNGNWNIPILIKKFNKQYCNNSLRSLDKLTGLLNYPYKFKL